MYFIALRLMRIRTVQAHTTWLCALTHTDGVKDSLTVITECSLQCYFILISHYYYLFSTLVLWNLSEFRFTLHSFTYWYFLIIDIEQEEVAEVTYLYLIIQYYIIILTIAHLKTKLLLLHFYHSLIFRHENSIALTSLLYRDLGQLQSLIVFDCIFKHFVTSVDHWWLFDHLDQSGSRSRSRSRRTNVGPM